jgi:hypothetical protein
LSSDVVSGVLDLLGRDVDDVDQDDLVEGREVLKELVKNFNLMIIERCSVHRFIKLEKRFIKFNFKGIFSLIRFGGFVRC